MPRPILDENQIHPAIREKIATRHADILREVQDAIGSSTRPAFRTSTSGTEATSDNGGGAARSRCGPAGRPSRWCS